MIPGAELKPILWLGAHKTGTTFLQDALELSDTALRQHGWRYMKLETFRKHYTRPLLYAGSHGAPKSPDPELNLFFDENIPNLVQHALGRKGLYPDLVARSLKIAAYFDLTDPDIHFGIRDYSGFLPSLYCETLKSTPYQNFQKFYQPGRHPLDWNNVLDRIRRAFPQSRIYVYLYEQLRGNEARLLSEITRIPKTHFILPGKISRPGFSHAAIDALDALAQERTVTVKDVLEVIHTYKKGKKHPSYQPFTPEQKAALKRKYQKDVNRLRERNDIRLIDIES